MKYIFFSFCLFIIGTNFSFAQTLKGDRHLGLTLGAVSLKSSQGGSFSFSNEHFSISVAPQYSYFVADQWEIGMSLGALYGKSKTTFQTDPSTEGHSRGGNTSLFLRKHFMISEKIGLRAGPYILFDYLKHSYEPNDQNDQIAKTWMGGFNLGVEFFPVKRLGLAANLAGISYQSSKITEGSDVRRETNDFGAGLTNQLNLSLFYVFGK